MQGYGSISKSHGSGTRQMERIYLNVIIYNTQRSEHRNKNMRLTKKQKERTKYYGKKYWYLGIVYGGDIFRVHQT
jgi:hypothetical protein